MVGQRLLVRAGLRAKLLHVVKANMHDLIFLGVLMYMVLIV